ncbi:MAG: MerR family transcriptional regulator [Sarcina sp.]
MYSIGETAEFLGLSRDTLKFYEEKGLVSPSKDSENGYRKYDMIDIHSLFLVNFYRDVDIDIKTLQSLKKNEEFGEIDEILNRQEAKLKEEIQRKKLVLSKIKDLKKNLKKIKANLNKYTIKEMEKYEVLEEISGYEDNLEKIFVMNKEAREKLGMEKKPLTLGAFMQEINFANEELLESKHLIIRKIGAREGELKGKVLEYKKCAYTIIKIRAVDNEEEGNAEMLKQHKECLRNIDLLNEKHMGIVFLKMSLSAYENNIPMLYIEMYVPLK